jgi:hypothetical protein
MSSSHYRWIEANFQPLEVGKADIGVICVSYEFWIHLTCSIIPFARHFTVIAIGKLAAFLAGSSASSAIILRLLNYYYRSRAIKLSGIYCFAVA